MSENTQATPGTLRDERTGATYDETPYESYAYPMTFPTRMGSIAKIFGYKYGALDKARVLELGCAGGGNILPLASLYPDAEFVGIDLSPIQIEEANAHKEALNLGNTTFEALDIMDFGKDRGEFDYIICHGVFSWVPDFVREKILNICQDNLSDRGLACISFNTLPGWAPLRSIREMMIIHTRDIEDPAKKVEQARLLVKSLANYMPQDASMRKAVENVHKKFEETDNDSYVLHEYLEPNNKQFYFSDYAAMLSEHGLSYVGDTDITTMSPDNIHQELGKVINQIPDPIKREQYMDFISNRQFRYSIVTKDVNKPASANLDSLTELAYSCSLVAEDKEYNKGGAMKFTKPDNPNFNITTADTFGKTLFWHLSQNRDYFYSFEDLVSLLCNALPDQKEDDIAKVLKSNLLNFILKGALVFQLQPSQHAQKPSNKPKAFALTQYQASLPGCRMVTNMNGIQIRLKPHDFHILRYLDGSKNMNQILNSIMPHAENGDFSLNDDKGIAVKDMAQVKKQLKAVLPKLIDVYCKKHLLTK